MSTLTDTLTRLAREFAVRDIMIPEFDLVCSSDASEAAKLLVKYPDFDMIPIRTRGVLTAFLERGGSTPRAIRVDDLVSDATSIFDAVDILTTRPRAFVLVRDRVQGYVHFSDLNRPIVKLPFFVLLEAVERYYFDMLGAEITPELLRTVLDPKRCSDLTSKMQRLKISRSNLNWATLLSFKELLLCARRLRSIGCEIADIDSLSKVRNLVCHAATDLLVEDHSHVRRLAGDKSTCLRLLGSH